MRSFPHQTPPPLREANAPDAQSAVRRPGASPGIPLTLLRPLPLPPLLLLPLLLQLASCSSPPPQAPSAPRSIEATHRLASQAAQLQADGNWAGAATWWNRAATQFRLLNQETNLAVAWHNEGVCRRALGQFDTARSRLGNAAELNQALGHTNAWWRNQIVLLQIDNDTRDLAAADTRLAQLAEPARSLNDPRLQALFALETSRALAQVQRWEPALSALEPARSGFEQAGDREGTGALLSARADLLDRLGRFAEAERTWRETLALQQSLGNARGVAIALAGLGTCLANQGQALDEADRLLRRAIANLEALGLQREAAVASERLARLTRHDQPR